METWKRTPLELFTLPQYFLIPLFQRPYVWEEDDQWSPLWKDITRVVERRLEAPSSQAAHFLGAVVLQSSEPVPGGLNDWNVIDGQQRLTTLQLLTDAVHMVFVEHEQHTLANKLAGLTHNAPHFVAAGASELKVCHLNKDRGAFDEVMNAMPPFEYDELEFAGARIVRAHEFFSSTAAEWLGSPEDARYIGKAEGLADVLQTGIQLVSINLTQTEDSQEIFETLNARGTPLTAADLVRNFVFQRLEQEGGDSKQAYERDWPFESEFWDKPISVGRQYISRSSLFLNQWLMAKLGSEISPHSTFREFKSFVEHDPEMRVTDLLPLLRAQADMYEACTKAAARSDGNLSPVEMAFYRMRAADTELLKPLVIWLTDPVHRFDDATIRRSIQAAESWIYRRQLLRLSNSGLTRTVADLIHANMSSDPTEVADRIIAQLSRLNVTSTYWPGDEEVRRALLDAPLYRRLRQQRLRMFIEAIEDDFRSASDQPQVQRGVLPIEHILPQKWETHWPVNSPEDELERNARVHRLGNLTLLTTSLNSKVSNGAWESKRNALLGHNTIALTGRIIAEAKDRAWDEAMIDARTQTLTDSLIRVWPVPVGHTGAVVDPLTKSAGWVELRHLAEAGLISPGDVLVSTHRDFTEARATVTSDFRLETGGAQFETPTGAAKHVSARTTNGWYFWALADGRRLREVRADFLANTTLPAEQ